MRLHKYNLTVNLEKGQSKENRMTYTKSISRVVLTIFVGSLLFFLYPTSGVIDAQDNADAEPVTSMDYLNRGSSYADLGEYDLAIEDYSKAIELDPEFLGAYLNRGLIYLYESQECDLAEADLALVLSYIADAEYVGAIEADFEVICSS